jgi:restriction system protein
VAAWVVRAGKYGEQEPIALERSVVTIGWNELPDLSAVQSREALAELYRKAHAGASSQRVGAQVGQIWAFVSLIQVGDLAVLPLKTAGRAIAVGEVAGPYQYVTNLGEGVYHVRKVKWLRTDIPRTAFGQDLLAHMGYPRTVYRLGDAQAAERIQAVLSGKPDPVGAGLADTEVDETDAQALDIEEAAGDQILKYIQANFAGHKLATLVAAVLRASGYQTEVSPPGPDGGVDILAGTGPMGFDQPRLCVQVKSSPTPADVNVLRGLQGILQNFHAEQGLLVCWGGFTQPAIKEARQSFFKIRLWNSEGLLAVILKHYDQLPADIQADLPLKRVWALVLEEE